MTIPIRTDSPLRHTPYMNYALIAANVVVFAVQRINPGFETRMELSPLDPTTLSFLSYAFVHAGWMHLIGNMLFLYIFGNNVNDKMGHVGYLGFYLSGAVFAGLGYVLAPSEGAPVVGASGAIAAVTGAYLVLFPLSHVTVLSLIYVIGQFEVASIWFILFWFGYDVFLNFARQDNVAHMAHIGGTVFGFALSFGLLMLHLLPRDQFDMAALVQRWNRRRQYRDVVASGYNPFGYAGAGRPPPPGRPAPAAPLDPKVERVMHVRAAIAEAVEAHDMARAAKLYTELKAVDPQQALARQLQLDVANELATERRYPQAAEAYETYLRAYPKAAQIEQVELMLGLIYARYLAQAGPAREYLTRAISRLHGERELAMARAELERLPAQ